MKGITRKRRIVALKLLVLLVPVTIVGISLLYFASAAAPSGEEMPSADLDGWKLVFTDNFDTNVPLGGFSGCSSSTHICTGLPASMQSRWWAYPDGWPDTSHNGTYSPSQVLSVQNGLLNINLHTANGIHMVAAALPKIPGAVGSNGGMQYGRYAIRFRSEAIPHYKTAWLLWPDSENWPADGEIDFPEGNLDSTISAYLHHQGASSGSDQDGYHTSATYTDWHTAVIEWMPGDCKFILDGKTVGESTNRVPNTPMHWVIQSESNLDGIVPSAGDGGNIQVDWVAVWQYSPSTKGPTVTPSNQPRPGDINGDGRVNVTDLSLLLSHWGNSTIGDLNGDGIVNVIDLSLLLAHWLP